MAFLSSFNIAASGLTAQRLRMDIIGENITNINTTRTEDGGPYRRKMVVLQSVERSSFRNVLDKRIQRGREVGVKVSQIVEDESPFQPVYNPEHPDADENGYVWMPNVDLLKETIDSMAASRAYEASLTAFNAIKHMAQKALELGR